MPPSPHCCRTRHFPPCCRRCPRSSCWPIPSAARWSASAISSAAPGRAISSRPPDSAATSSGSTGSFSQARDFPLTPRQARRYPARRPDAVGRLPASERDDRPLTLSWEVGGFCQVNLAQNRRLIDTVVDFTAPGPGDTVLDLFCGMGNFSIPLARRCRSLLGIEGQGSAIRSARANSLRAGLANCRIPPDAPARRLRGTRPQRQGLRPCGHRPAATGRPGPGPDSWRASPPAAWSISPATRRPSAATSPISSRPVSSSGALQPVDMFPQTHHIETVVLLEKN